MPITAERRNAVFRFSNEALVRFFDDVTIAILRIAEDSAELCGSGTCLQVGERFLIATAAHVVRDYPAAEMSFVFSRKPTEEQIHPARSGWRGGGNNDQLDVGWLEVSSEDAARLGKRFLSIGRVEPFRAELPNDWVLFSGFPLELIPTELAKLHRLRLQAIGYYTFTLKDSEWPSGGDPTVDLYLSYPQSVEHTTTDGTLVGPPHPKGTSGGGIWAAHIADKGVWSPDRARLIGIEHAFLKSADYVRGTQVQHWLRMVAEDIPELAKEIEPLIAVPGGSGPTL